MKIVVDPATRARLEKLALALPQGVLLTGDKGVGLLTIASELLATNSNSRVIRPRLLTKTSTLPQISIDDIREFYTMLRGKFSQAQIVIIDDADTMTVPAQNSFLKLLEEPPSAVRFVLTSHHAEKLLPTVRSRVQIVNIAHASAQQTRTLLADYKDLSETELRQISFIATGLPAELLRLASDKIYRTKVIQATASAKQLLEASSGERALLIAKIPADRAGILLIIEKMMQIVKLHPSRSGVQLLERLIVAHMRILQNGNVRLQLSAAMV